MSRKSSFEWEGPVKKPETADKVTLYVIWSALFFLFLGIGSLIGKKMDQKTGENLVFTAELKTTAEVYIEKVKSVETSAEKVSEPVKNVIISSEKKEIEKTVETVLKSDQEHTLKLESVFKNFRQANNRALELSDMNLDARIVPDNEGYHIEIGKFQDMAELQSLKDMLSGSGIVCSSALLSENSLAPQKDLEKELSKLREAAMQQSEKTAEIASVVTDRAVVKDDPVKSTVTAEIKADSEKSGTPETKVTEKTELKEEISQKITAAVKEILNEKPEETKELQVSPAVIKEEKKEPQKGSFTLQAGAYRQLDGAEKLRDFLEGKFGRDSFIIIRNEVYKVCFGQFETYEEAKTFSENIFELQFEGGNIGFFIFKL